MILRQQHGLITRSDGSDKQLQLLEELELFCAQDGPLRKCTLDQLNALATVVYDEYLMTEAFHSALSDPGSSSQPSAPEIDALLMQNIQNLLSSTQEQPKSTRHAQNRNLPTVTPVGAATLLSGDQVLANGKLFMRDALEFVEFCLAMEDGDPGRLFKVMDVSCCAYMLHITT